MKTAYYKYFAALLLFGSNGVVASHIALPSYEIVLLRTLIGSLFLLAVFKFSGQQLTFYQNKRAACFCVFPLWLWGPAGCCFTKPISRSA